MKPLFLVVAAKLPYRMTAIFIVCVASITFGVGIAEAGIVTYGFVEVAGTGLDSEGEFDPSRVSRSRYVESESSLYATDSLLSYIYEVDASLKPFTSFAGVRANDGALGAFASSGRFGQANATVFWSDSIQLLPPQTLLPGVVVPSTDSLQVWFQIEGALTTTANDGGSSGAEIIAHLNGTLFAENIQSHSILVDEITSTFSDEFDSRMIDARVVTAVDLINGVGDISYDLGVIGTSHRGSSNSDFFGTLKLTSITFADGSTPESHGYTIAFASGMPSPNVNAVPEPSSFASLGIGMLVFIAGRMRRRAPLAALA